MIKAIIVIFFCFLAQSICAQRIEVGVAVGGMSYFGDLNPNTSFQFSQPAASLFLRNNISTRFAFKHAILAGRVMADDAKSKNLFQQQRNLSFRSNILELSSQFEFHFLDFNYRKPKQNFTPYLAVGASFFYYNPQARYQGQWIDLQPLGTEGQNDPSYSGLEPYNAISYAWMIGGGAKYRIKRSWIIGIDIVNRRTFTDYLDDVSGVYPSVLSLNVNPQLAQLLSDRSAEVEPEPVGRAGFQRGISDRKDDYLVFQISFSYNFIKLHCPWPSRGF